MGPDRCCLGSCIQPACAALGHLIYGPRPKLCFSANDWPGKVPSGGQALRQRRDGQEALAGQQSGSWGSWEGRRRRDAPPSAFPLSLSCFDFKGSFIMLVLESLYCTWSHSIKVSSAASELPHLIHFQRIRGKANKISVPLATSAGVGWKRIFAATLY